MTSVMTSIRRVAEYIQAWDAYEAESCASTTEHLWDRVERLWDALSEDERSSVPDRCRPLTVRVSFEPLPLPKDYSPVHAGTIRIRLNEEGER